MASLSLEYGGDLTPSPSGDVAVVDGDVRARQRIMRVLCTNPRQVLPDGTVLPPDYLYHPDFGAGIGRLVGKSIGTKNVNLIESAVRSAVQSDRSVASYPPVRVAIDVLSDGIRIRIYYQSSITKTPQQIGFALST